MNLFIRIKNGQPFEHPILEDNFKEAFPNVDVNNLPPEFAKFERIEQPQLATYEVADGVSYHWDSGRVKDVWHIRQMTDEEKIEKDKILLSQATAQLELLKNLAAENIKSSTTEDALVWQSWLDKLNTWAILDLAQPTFPAMPRKSSSGQWLTTENSGGEPNVID